MSTNKDFYKTIESDLLPKNKQSKNKVKFDMINNDYMLSMYDKINNKKNLTNNFENNLNIETFEGISEARVESEKFLTRTEVSLTPTPTSIPTPAPTTVSVVTFAPTPTIIPTSVIPKSISESETKKPLPEIISTATPKSITTPIPEPEAEEEEAEEEAEDEGDGEEKPEKPTKPIQTVAPTKPVPAAKKYIDYGFNDPDKNTDIPGVNPNEHYLQHCQIKCIKDHYRPFHQRYDKEFPEQFENIEEPSLLDKIADAVKSLFK